jgi:hypothetical protein
MVFLGMRWPGDSAKSRAERGWSFYFKSIEPKEKGTQPGPAGSQQEKTPSSKVSAAPCALVFPRDLDPPKLSLRIKHNDVLAQPNIRPMLERPSLKTTCS